MKLRTPRLRLGAQLQTRRANNRFLARSSGFVWNSEAIDPLLPSHRHIYGSILRMKFDEVKIVDDAVDSLGLIKEIIRSKDQEDAFYILDIGDVVNKHKTWLSKMPRVEPHFAIKCNPDKTVIKTLAALNAGFDCASKQEISQVLAAGVSGDRIIFANTVKLHSHIKYAKKVGVTDFTVDSEEELYKMKNIFPEANIIIRFRCDAKIAGIELGSKHGCDSVSEAPKLIRMTKDLGLHLSGFSFHVGSECGETMAYNRGIKISMDLIEYAKSQGFNDVKMIDIGGGFPGESNFSIDKFADAINEALEEVDPSIRVISEPGTFYVASAFTLSTLVYGKRIVEEGDKRRYMYYINDGIFGSFIDNIIAGKVRLPIFLNEPANNETHASTIWGPTLDTTDCVISEHWLPEFHIGDWLVWPNMGAYTIALAGTFNGIPPPVVFPVIKRKIWNSLGFNESVNETDGILAKVKIMKESVTVK